MTRWPSGCGRSRSRRRHTRGRPEDFCDEGDRRRVIEPARHDASACSAAGLDFDHVPSWPGPAPPRCPCCTTRRSARRPPDRRDAEPRRRWTANRSRRHPRPLSADRRREAGEQALEVVVVGRSPREEDDSGRSWWPASWRSGEWSSMTSSSPQSRRHLSRVRAFGSPPSASTWVRLAGTHRPCSRQACADLLLLAGDLTRTGRSARPRWSSVSCATSAYRSWPCSATTTHSTRRRA